MKPTTTPPLPLSLRRDGLVILLLGSMALALFCCGRNPELQGDDDYLYAANFSRISDAMLSLDTSHPGPLAAGLWHLAATTFTVPRHAMLPASLHAGFYALCHVRRQPFTLDLLHLPTALMGALAVALFYLVARRQSLSRAASASLSVMLAISPVFTMCGRGLATYFLVAIPLSQLIALLAIDQLLRTGQPRWWMGMALAQIALMDTIWFISLPCLAIALWLAEPDRRRARRYITSPALVVPPLLIALLILAGSYLAYRAGLSTPLAKLLTDHGPGRLNDLPIILVPSVLATCGAYLLGVAAPPLLLIALGGWLAGGRPLFPRPAALFAATALVIYGLLFYVVPNKHDFVKLCYQIYLLVPLLLFMPSLLAGLTTRFPSLLKALPAGLAALLVFEALACITFVGKIPVSPRSALFADWAHGTFAPNQGTKAAGDLVRQWIEAVWRQNPRQPVTLLANHYNVSFAVFSGINEGERGGAYVPEFGPHRRITVLHRSLLLNGLEPSRRGDPDPFAYLIDFTGQDYPADEREPIVHAPPELAYHIVSSSPRNRSAWVFIRTTATGPRPPLVPGDLSMEELEAHYDRTYTRYSDFFPLRYTLE